MLPEQYVSSSSYPVICVSSDYSILALNDVTCSLLDAEPAYFLRKNLQQVFCDVDNDTKLSLNAEHYTRVWYTHPEGHRYIVSLSIESIQETGGKLSLLYLKDTDRQLQQHKLSQRYLDVFENIEEAVFLAPIDDTGVHKNFIDVNKAARDRLGYSKQEMLDMNARSLNPSLNLDRVRAFGRSILREKLIQIEAIHVTRDGTQIPVDVTAKLIERQGKKYVLSFARDLRENKKRQQTEQMLIHLVDFSWDEIYIYNSENFSILHANHGALENLGYTTNEINNLTFDQIQFYTEGQNFEQLTAELRAGNQGQLIFEAIHTRKNGSLYPVEVSLQLSHSEVPPVFLANIKDISRRKDNEEKLRYLANYDALTGLPNRSFFIDRLGLAMANCSRTSTLLALMFIDLDGFKLVNDSYGHNVGDELIRQVGQRLQGIVRKSDTAARLGGDEFTIIFTNLYNLEGMQKLAQKVLDTISSPYDIEGIRIHSSPSIGVTFYPFCDDDALQLIKQADMAMYQAKAGGKNQFQFYTASLAKSSHKRQQLESDISAGLEREEFYLHYQPRVDLRSGKLRGVEALMRWQHPQLGHISPGEFIPLMEKNGLIIDASLWGFEQALMDLARWLPIEPELKLSFNFSARQLDNDNFLFFLEAKLQEYYIPAQNIEIEITEGILLSNTSQAFSFLNRIKKLGLSISLDDFGTGYSSLNYLQQFPIDTIKIDREFTSAIEKSNNTGIIIETIIGLAHSLGLSITAEGIENKEQLGFLQMRNCDEGQGFYFDKALPDNEITKIVERQSIGKLVYLQQILKT